MEDEDGAAGEDDADTGAREAEEETVPKCPYKADHARDPISRSIRSFRRPW